jgi:hypothetical protein
MWCCLKFFPCCNKEEDYEEEKIGLEVDADGKPLSKFARAFRKMLLEGVPEGMTLRRGPSTMSDTMMMGREWDEALKALSHVAETNGLSVLAYPQGHDDEDENSDQGYQDVEEGEPADCFDSE